MMRDKQQDLPAAYCGRCGAELYREDDVYLWDGQRICRECIKAKIDCLTIAEIAELLGATMMRAGDLHKG